MVSSLSNAALLPWLSQWHYDNSTNKSLVKFLQKKIIFLVQKVGGGPRSRTSAEDVLQQTWFSDDKATVTQAGGQ